MSPKPKANQRLRLARREASKDLGLPLDHWAVRRTALLSVAHENLEHALVDGHRVDISDLLKVEEALNAVKAALPSKPIPVTLTFVDGATGKRSTDLKELRPPNKPTGPTQIDGEATEVKPDAAVKAAPASPPLPPPAPPRNPSMAAWERATGRGYSRSSKDGGPIHGAPAFDPDSKYNQGYNNDLPSCWVGGTGNGLVIP
jgi:hypothetical protein